MNTIYSAEEASIHTNRYSLAKPHCYNKKILDISCGEGYGSYLMYKWGAAEVIGVDISKETIEKATNNFGNDKLKYICNDAMNLDIFEDNSFDMVVSFETIEHLTNPEKYLKEIKRVAKKDAIIIISCPNDYFYYPTNKTSNPYHIKKYRKEEFYELVKSVLGEPDNYIIGAKVSGYANIYPIEKKCKNQIDMLDYEEKNGDILVQSDEIINEKNCSYFVYSWNIKGDMSSITAYYKGMNDEKENYIIELQERIKELETYQIEMQERIKELETYQIELQERIKELGSMSSSVGGPQN